jgi:hypothetical protein
MTAVRRTSRLRTLTGSFWYGNEPRCNKTPIQDQNGVDDERRQISWKSAGHEVRQVGPDRTGSRPQDKVSLKILLFTGDALLFLHFGSTLTDCRRYQKLLQTRTSPAVPAT